MISDNPKPIVRLALVLTFYFRTSFLHRILKRPAMRLEKQINLPPMSWGGFALFTFTIGPEERGSIVIRYGFPASWFKTVIVPFKFRAVEKIECCFEKLEETTLNDL